MQTQHTRLQALYQTPAGIFGPSNCDKGRLLSLDSIRFLLDDSLFKADSMVLAYKDLIGGPWAQLLYKRPDQW